MSTHVVVDKTALLRLAQESIAALDQFKVTVRCPAIGHTLTEIMRTVRNLRDRILKAAFGHTPKHASFFFYLEEARRMFEFVQRFVASARPRLKAA